MEIEAHPGMKGKSFYWALSMDLGGTGHDLAADDVPSSNILFDSVKQGDSWERRLRLAKTKTVDQ